MKTRTLRLTLTLACALALMLGQRVPMHAETNTPSFAAAAEDLGFDFYEGKTNKIAKVYSVTPTHVQVLHEGGKSGRNIPRQSLPPQLAAKYPYDAAKAAEYQKQQADLATQQIVTAQAIARENVRKQEQQLLNEVARLTRLNHKLANDFALQKQMPKGRGKKATLTNLVNERQQVADNLAKLQAQLDALRARQASM